MSWNGNDIQFLSIIDRVKRLEVSTLKKVLGKYVTNETNLTTLVEGLQSALNNLEYVKSIAWNGTTFTMTITNEDDTTSTIDLPLEQMIVDVTYDDVEKELIFELNNGTTLVVPLSDIIDGLVKTSDIVDNLTTDDATKVLSAKQGKVLQDGKLDKVTSSSSFSQLYYKNPTGTNQGMVNFGPNRTPSIIVQREGNGLINIFGGNRASRPTTGLIDGQQYFNTDTKQLEVYIGDTNHWLNQVYKNGDTLPTPASGTSHTYHVISDGTTLSGTASITIDGESVYGGSVFGTTLIVRNNSGSIAIYNMDNVDGVLVVDDLTISSSYLALKRVA